MQIYPAIDVKDGQCVRLTQGDFAKSTTYAKDPLVVARAFKAQGATWLHVVDLDGARDPTRRQRDVIAGLAGLGSLKLQVGGGVRSLDDVDEFLALGAARVVVGSLAVKRPDLVARILESSRANRIVLGFDVRSRAHGYLLATDGWTVTSSLGLADVLSFYGKLARHILCTDIDRDGTLAGPNTGLYRFLVASAPRARIQASGGVRSLADLTQLRAANVAGVVVGKALYERKFSLQSALSEHNHAH